MSKVPRIRYADAAAFATGVAGRIARLLEAGLVARPRASLVVPGGTTPGPVFDLLHDADLDWSRIDITLSDERWVPGSDPGSNERLVRERLLRGRAAAATLLGLYRPTGLPSAAVDTVSTALDAIARPFDVVLLGLGEDGHTASLFPDRADVVPALDASTTATLWPIDAPAKGHSRMTLTLSALLDARLVMLAFTGQPKQAVLERAYESGPLTELPARALLHQHQTPVEIHWAS